MRDKDMNSVSRWRDLRLRLISAAIMLPVGLGLIASGGPVFTGAVMLVGAGMVREGLDMQAQSGLYTSTWRRILLYLWPAVCALLALHGDWFKVVLVIMYSGIFGLHVIALMFPVCLGVASLVFLRHLPVAGVEQILFVVTIVIASDSCAYLTGRCIGGRKLVPRISPNKTQSGAIGGLMGAAMIGAIWAAFLTPDYILRGAVNGALLGLFAQTGDLVESFAKRRLGVKDSGSIIPGHGGLLDRMDGLLGAAPVAALLTLGAGARPFWCVHLKDMIQQFLR